MGKSDRSTTDSHEKIGIIDLGSNTVLLLVLDHSGLVVADELRITRLAERVFESGRLSPGARERTRRAVSELAETAREAGAERLIGVGTAALRHARDGAAFLSSLQRPGLLDEGRVLSGAEEAILALVGESHRKVEGQGQAKTRHYCCGRVCLKCLPEDE